MTPTYAMGWTLVHTLWQGALIASVVAIVLSLMPRARAQVRYAVSVAGLVLMSAAAILTGAREVRHAADARFAAGGPASAWGLVDRERGGSTPGSTADRVLAVSGGRLGESDGMGADRTDAAMRSGAGFATLLGAWSRGIEPALPFIVAIWFGGVLLLSARLVGGLARLRALRLSAEWPVPSGLTRRVATLSERMGVRRAVRLLASARVDTPAIIGWLRPVLLFPVSAMSGMPLSQLEGLIAHELAHIRRHDFAVNLFQVVVETLLFYHPAVWWISARIRSERENCCDDLAVVVCGDSRVYAMALLELETRRAASALAVAATGGSLRHRIRRLVLPSEPRENGARWAAGVFALLTVAAAFTSAQASQARGAARGSPSRSVDAATRADAIAPESASQDPSRTRPSRVVRYSGGAPIEARVAWARTEARDAGHRQYWLGYAVERVDDGMWHYFDRHVPVRAGESNITGRLRISGNSSSMRFNGADLAPLVGQRAPHSLAILFGFEGNRLVRTHLSSFVFPVHFDGWPLYWVGAIETGESVGLIEALFATAESALQQEDLVAMAGALGPAPEVMPALLRWATPDHEENVRVAAIEAMGSQADPRALAALARMARRDAAPAVRSEAAESVGDIPLAQATDTLIALATSLEDEVARSEAVEALGERSGPRVSAALARIARSDASLHIRTEAVETLGDLEAGAGVPALLELLRDDLAAQVRAEVIETLSESEDPRALDAILDLVKAGPGRAAQIEAVESLGDSHQHERAIQALRDIALTHDDADLRRIAVDQLANFESVSIVELLREIATRDPVLRVQRAAVESLGSAHPHDAAIAALRGLIDDHPRIEIRVAGVEALGDFEASLVVDILADIARRHPDRRVQRQATETLSDLRGR